MTKNQLRRKYPTSAIPRACRSVVNDIDKNRREERKAARTLRRIKRLQAHLLSNGYSPQHVSQTLSNMVN